MVWWIFFSTGLVADGIALSTSCSALQASGVTFNGYQMKLAPVSLKKKNMGAEELHRKEYKRRAVRERRSHTTEQTSELREHVAVMH